MTPFTGVSVTLSPVLPCSASATVKSASVAAMPTVTACAVAGTPVRVGMVLTLKPSAPGSVMVPGAGLESNWPPSVIWKSSRVLLPSVTIWPPYSGLARLTQLPAVFCFQ